MNDIEYCPKCGYDTSNPCGCLDDDDPIVEDFCIEEVEDEENKALYDAQEQEEAELRDEYYSGFSGEE